MLMKEILREGRMLPFILSSPTSLRSYRLTDHSVFADLLVVMPCNLRNGSSLLTQFCAVQVGTNTVVVYVACLASSNAEELPARVGVCRRECRRLDGSWRFRALGLSVLNVRGRANRWTLQRSSNKTRCPRLCRSHYREHCSGR